MDREELLEKLLNTYKSSFDIFRPYTIGDEEYDAYAGFSVTSSKYVLVKRAELWRAHCFEHVFFRLSDRIGTDELNHLKKNLLDEVEPNLVRGKEKCPPANHMYTYVTWILLAKGPVDRELEKAIHKFRYYKNYRFSIRGYCQARLVVFDMERKKVFGNAAAKDLLREFKRLL